MKAQIELLDLILIQSSNPLEWQLSVTRRVRKIDNSNFQIVVLFILEGILLLIRSAIPLY
jgi:hypothetical protein